MRRSAFFYLLPFLFFLAGLAPTAWSQNDGETETTEMEVVAEKNKKKKDKKKKGKGKKKKKEKEEEVVEELENPLCDTTRTYMGELCPRYRTGRLKFIDKNFIGISVKRKRRKEIWVNNTTHNKLKFKIEWGDNSCYTLTFKKSKEPVRYRPGDKIYCRIRACHPEPENYCDVDMDHHTVIDYASLYRPLSKKEVKLKMKKERELLKKQEEAAWKAKQDSTDRANGVVPASETPEKVEGEDGGNDGTAAKKAADEGGPEMTAEEKKQAKADAKAQKKADKEAAKAAKKAEKEAEKAAKEKEKEEGGEDGG